MSAAYTQHTAYAWIDFFSSSRPPIQSTFLFFFFFFFWRGLIFIVGILHIYHTQQAEGTTPSFLRNAAAALETGGTQKRKHLFFFFSFLRFQIGGRSECRAVVYTGRAAPFIKSYFISSTWAAAATVYVTMSDDRPGHLFTKNRPADQEITYWPGWSLFSRLFFPFSLSQHFHLISNVYVEGEQ